MGRKKRVLLEKEPPLPHPQLDRLDDNGYGFFEAISWIKPNKPASVRYFVKCKNCGKDISIAGSQTTRKRNLIRNPLMLCPHCELNMFRDNRARIAKSHEIDLKALSSHSERA